MRHDQPATPPRRAAARRLLSVLALLLIASGARARAATFYDVSLGLDVGDDARLFLNVTNDYFAPPPTVAARLVQRCPRPENDYPVILLLARASHRPPDQILQMWLSDGSWADIMFELKVPASVLFAGLSRDPGPPYGKAWGRYRAFKGKGRLEISDRDVVELAKLQVAAGYYRVSPYGVIAERQRGVRVEQYVADRHRAKHGEEKAARGQGKGEDGDRGKGSKGHGHGHGKPGGKPDHD